MTASSANLQIPKAIVSFQQYTKIPIAFAASAAVATGDFVVSAQGPDGLLYKVTATGILNTGGTAPSHTGGTAASGSAVLEYVDWIDLGEVPKVNWTTESETKDYFSNRSGTKERVLQVLLTKKGGLTVTLNEASHENFQIALLGDITGATGARDIDIFKEAQTMGRLKAVGTNDVGPKKLWFWGYVRFLPGKEMPIIGDDWWGADMDGEVNKDVFGSFGTVRELT